LEKSKNIKIKLKNAEFNCRVLGNGHKKIIAFHGVRQDGNAFSLFAVNNPVYTFYCFDLPFHGGTKISDHTKCLSDRDIISLVSKLSDMTGMNLFSLIGFSIGAKLIYPIVSHFSEKTEAVWLIAPDGIKLNPWYRTATSSSLMRSIFQYLLQKPDRLNQLVHFLHRMHITDKKTMKFVLNSVNSKTSGERIYKTWIYLRNLKPDINKLTEQIERDNVKVIFFMGAFDKLIPKDYILPLSTRISDTKTIIKACGHTNLFRQVAQMPFSDYIDEN
jgi:pimeloyl-ACP methyl ester carboxylesterase